LLVEKDLSLMHCKLCALAMA